MLPTFVLLILFTLRASGYDFAGIPHSVSCEEDRYLNQYVPIRSIYKGFCSNVTLCSLRDDKSRVVVLKSMGIVHPDAIEADLIQADAEIRIQRRMSDHPFITTLRDSFVARTPQANISYLALEYYPNGNLLDVLLAEPTFTLSVDRARKILAQIVSAVEALHQNDIMHNDLKITNVFFDAQNNAIVADFGLAMEGIKTITGSMTEGRFRPFSYQSFFAPECMRQVKMRSDPSVSVPLYGKSVDYYAIGHLLYRMLGGVHATNDEPGEIGSYLYKLANNLPYTEDTMPLVALNNVQSDTARDLIVKLLQIDVHKRLGSTHGVIEIKQHPFFNGFFEKPSDKTDTSPSSQTTSDKTQTGKDKSPSSQNVSIQDSKSSNAARIATWFSLLFAFLGWKLNE